MCVVCACVCGMCMCVWYVHVGVVCACVCGMCMCVWYVHVGVVCACVCGMCGMYMCSDGSRGRERERGRRGWRKRGDGGMEEEGGTEDLSLCDVGYGSHGMVVIV